MDDELVASLSLKIDSKHKLFLETAGEIPYKVSADYSLLRTSVTSKISLIALALREAGVVSNHTLNFLGEGNKFIFYKNGLDCAVQVMTNGTLICMSTCGALMDNDSSFMLTQWYHPKKTGWDWEDFSEQLVDFIHFTMYKSQKVEEVNIELLMEGESR